MKIPISVFFFLLISPVFSQRTLMFPWKFIYSLLFNRIHWDVTRIHLYSSISGVNILDYRASLVAQWLRICLPMQGTRVWALVQEDLTCHGATKPMHQNYWACALEPTSYNYWACVPQLLKPALLEPMLCNKGSHRNEKPVHRNEE